MNITSSLTEELLRTYEIMGIKPKILLEVSGGPIDDIARDASVVIISRLNQVLSDQVGAEVQIFGNVFRKSEVQQAINTLRRDDFNGAFRSTTNNVRKIIILELKNNETASMYSYSKLIDKKISDGAFEKESNLLEKVKGGVTKDQSKEPFDVFKSLFKDEWREIIEISENTFNRQYNEFINNPARFKPIKVKMSETINPSQGGNKLSKRDLEKASAALREKNIRKFNIDYLNALITSSNSAKSKIVKLTRGYYEALSGVESAAEKTKLADQYAVQIVRLLNILEARENNAAREALKTLNIDEDIVKIISEDSREFFKLYRTTWGFQAEETLRDEVLLVFNNFWDDVKSIFSRNGEEGKLVSILIKRFFKSINLNNRFGQYLLTDSFATFDKQWQQMIKQSGLQDGNRFNYIVVMLWLNSCGYVIGDIVKDLIETVLDLVLSRHINKLLPFEIGREGEDPIYTFERIDTEKTDKIFDMTEGGLGEFISNYIYQSINDIWKEISEGNLLERLWKNVTALIERTMPFGIGTYDDSITFAIVNWMTDLNVEDPVTYSSRKLQSMLGSLLAAEVTPKWEDNEDELKRWFKANYPEQKNNVRRYNRNYDDPQNIYYEVKMKGTQTTDYYFKYDSQNKTFKPYE